MACAWTWSLPVRAGQAMAAVREGDTLVVPKLAGWYGLFWMPAPSQTNWKSAG